MNIMDVSIETALTMLCVALDSCKTDEDRQQAKATIFESAEGILALEQLEHELGLLLYEYDADSDGWELAPIPAEMIRNA